MSDLASREPSLLKSASANRLLTMARSKMSTFLSRYASTISTLMRPDLTSPHCRHAMEEKRRLDV